MAWRAIGGLLLAWIEDADQSGRVSYLEWTPVSQVFLWHIYIYIRIEIPLTPCAFTLLRLGMYRLRLATWPLLSDLQQGEVGTLSYKCCLYQFYSSDSLETVRWWTRSVPPPPKRSETIPAGIRSALSETERNSRWFLNRKPSHTQTLFLGLLPATISHHRSSSWWTWIVLGRLARLPAERIDSQLHLASLVRIQYPDTTWDWNI